MPPTKNKGYSFWHLISEGEREEERIPDFGDASGFDGWHGSSDMRRVMTTYVGGKINVCSNTHIVIWHEQEFAVGLAQTETDTFF